MNDKDAAELSKALGHPLRLEILREMRKRKTASPNDLSKGLDEPLGNISYHVMALRNCGAVEVVDLVPRRGAMEHRYALSATPRAALICQMLDLMQAS